MGYKEISGKRKEKVKGQYIDYKNVKYDKTYCGGYCLIYGYIVDKDKYDISLLTAYNHEVKYGLINKGPIKGRRL